MWLVLIITLWTCSTAYQILYGINCGSTSDIVSPSVTYSADRYFTQDTFTLHKSYVSRNIKDYIERSLVRNERTSKKDFSYLLPIKEEGRFGIKCVKQYEFVDPEMRVFGIKLGDQTLFSIDIIEQVGAKKALTKFIQFQLKNGIVYLQTTPALNAFNFVDKAVALNFQKIKGNPKVQMILVIKGALDRYKKQHTQLEKSNIQTQPMEYLCQRLHDATHNNVYSDQVSMQEANPYYYFYKIFWSKGGILSLLLFLMIVFKDWVIREFENKIRELERKYNTVYLRIKEKEK